MLGTIHQTHRLCGRQRTASVGGWRITQATTPPNKAIDIQLIAQMVPFMPPLQGVFHKPEVILSYLSTALFHI